MNEALSIIEEAATMLENIDDLKAAWDILAERQKQMTRRASRLLKVGQAVEWSSSKRRHAGETFYGRVTDIGRTGKVRVTDQHGRSWIIAAAVLTPKGGGR